MDVFPEPGPTALSSMFCMSTAEALHCTNDSPSHPPLLPLLLAVHSFLCVEPYSSLLHTHKRAALIPTSAGSYLCSAITAWQEREPQGLRFHYSGVRENSFTPSGCSLFFSQALPFVCLRFCARTSLLFIPPGVVNSRPRPLSVLRS